MGIDLPAPAKHIRLTSHHPIDGVGCAPLIRWGAADAQNGACDYVVSNGISKSYIANINSPATGVASVPVSAQSVQVQLKRTDIPVFFGRVLGLRYAPELEFEFDPGPERAARIDVLLRSARKD